VFRGHGDWVGSKADRSDHRYSPSVACEAPLLVGSALDRPCDEGSSHGYVSTQREWMTASKPILQRSLDQWPRSTALPTLVLSLSVTADQLTQCAGLEFTRELDDLGEVDACLVQVDEVLFGVESRPNYPEAGTHIYVDIRTPFRIHRARELVRLLGLPSEAIYWEENP
jgi:hypothetical protein